MNYKREQLADLILDKLNFEKERISKDYLKSVDTIGYFIVDDLLPGDLVQKIFESFPSTKDSVLKMSLREYKYIAVQMDKYEPILEEVIYAFQDIRIINFFKSTFNIESLYPDSNLYAGGLSLMGHDNFLNPHLDNSHDKDRDKWRVFNLLYYVTPDWKLANGGNLELWPQGLQGDPIKVISKFNRLAVMTTHHKSWHSVSKVVANDVRCCVSNYYFSNQPLLHEDNFHVTSFRGWPSQKLIDSILRVDSKLRGIIRKVFRKGIVKNPHVYKKKSN